MLLHRDADETVTMERWAPGAEIALDAAGGLEALVVAGGFSEGGEDFAVQSWLRLPDGARSRARAGSGGAQVWIKRGHLAGGIRAPGTA